MSNARAEQLMQQGYNSLEAGEFERAIGIADQLQAMRHTSAFEIGGRALWETDRRNEAIALLRRGVRKAPSLSILWHYLGCYLSDQDEFDQALQALRRATSCPDAQRDVESFNIALVHQRAGCYADAIAELDQISEHDQNVPLPLRLGLRAALMCALESYDESLRLVDEALRLADSGDEFDVGHGERARMLATRSSVLLRGRGDREAALASALDAIACDSRNRDAIVALRAAEGVASRDARLWRILIEGRWHEPLHDDVAISRFFRSYDVIADDVTEAFRLLQRFEPEEVRVSLRVDESEDLGARPEEFKGVVSVDGYVFYGHEE